MTRRLSLFISLLAVAILSGVIASSVAITNAQFGTSSWTATFYNDTGFSNQVAGTYSYSALNLNWPGQPTSSSGQPISGVGADNFSVIFTSTQIMNAGVYRFQLTVDDRATVTLNGVQIFNITTPNTTQTVDVQVPGGSVNMRVNFIEFTASAFISLQWTPVSTSGSGLPGQPVFFTPTPVPTATPTITPLPPIPAGALTATVIRASVLNVRSAPSLGGVIVGQILRGQTYAVLGRDENARWFLLQISGRQGWSFGYYLWFNRNEFTAPVVSGNTLADLAGQPDYGVRAQTRATMRLRAAPTTASAQIGRVTWGAFVPVVGRTANNVWWQIVWKGTVGWVYSPFVRVIDGDINNVPVR